MVSISKFRIPVEEFALAETVEKVPDLHIEINPFVAQSLDAALPVAWIRTDDFEAFEQEIEEDSTVEECSRLTGSDDERLYRLEWASEVEGNLQILLSKECAIKTVNLESTTERDVWKLELICPEHETLSEIYKGCEENGISVTVDAIYRLDSDGRTADGLSKLQYQSLLKAHEMGYYNVPREVSLSDLADELNVSHQALSERLRRGHGRLVESASGSTDPLKSKKNFL